MKPSSRTPEGQPNRCPVCKNENQIEPSHPIGDAPCSHCGHLLWFPAIVELKSPDFFVGNGRIYEIDVVTKREAVETLVRRVSESGHFRTHVVPSIVHGVMRREELASTGIGYGVAIPNTKHDSIKRFVGIIGHVPSGINFDSLDGELVKRIFLLLSPPNKPAEHLRALELISRILQPAA